MSEWSVAPDRVLAVVQGDITRIPADAIVNAANDRLLPGGGVCGAIFDAGGPAILVDLQARYGANMHCPTGDARVSAAGDLPARLVIHAVGPVWRDVRAGEAELLASAYRAAIRQADEHACEHVTFPAISTGIYGYPPEAAAAVAVETVARELAGASHVRRVTLVAYSAASAAILETALTPA
jgi:O-acetyl-ADP-ribose deacetylase (regulator of RNase III)